MFKIIKTQITGSLKEGSEIGINANYRTTMGYDSEDKTISVKVEKVNRPDLTREEDVEVTYTEVASRIFGVQDFPRNTDNITWFTEYDVEANKITDPVEIWDWVATLHQKSPPAANVTYTLGSLQTDFAAHFNSKLLPLFHLASFNKSAEDFDDSMLQFYTTNTDETSLSPSDTVLSNTNLDIKNSLEKMIWYSSNVLPQITYDVLDADGNVVNVQQTKTVTPRHQKVSLAKADEYSVRINFAKPAFENVSNTYNVTVVNGGINKNRIVISEGSSTVLINARGLNSGDFVKLKLNIGKYVSFAEFWIEIQ
jgi:hypothetical protein